ncbi:hypothetical protein TRAPUB_2395 [Trametes pubescens]|uniref:Uncharacterized protein n=1 Tax=Trametes pubescens TaxID=154538 RepID=A0A1M2VGP8_TRAPU|nr:hypothetical protein TRAPUB_2395 [Trametes pubescens]
MTRVREEEASGSTEDATQGGHGEVGAGEAASQAAASGSGDDQAIAWPNRARTYEASTREKEAAEENESEEDESEEEDEEDGDEDMNLDN